jgi:hypothetical protein
VVVVPLPENHAHGFGIPALKVVQSPHQLPDRQRRKSTDQRVWFDPHLIVSILPRRRASWGTQVSLPTTFVGAWQSGTHSPNGQVCDAREASAQQPDIEAQRARLRVHSFFVLDQKIDQDCPDRASVQCAGHLAISGAVTAAAAAMSEKNKTARALGERQLRGKCDAANRHAQLRVLNV